MNKNTKLLRDAAAGTLTGGGTTNPADLPITNANLIANNVKDAINELQADIDALFLSASNGKETIATAIAGKGQPIIGGETFSQLATKISAIQTGSAITKITKLNVTAPYTKTIVLGNERSIENLCTSVLEYVVASGLAIYNCTFNNGDSSNFVFDTNYIDFSTNNMTMKTSFSIAMVDEGVLGTGRLYTADLPKSDLNSIASLSVSDTTLNYTGTPKAQIIKATGSINITGVDTISGVTLNKVSSGNGKALVIVSFDDGVTYNKISGGVWSTVDVTSVNDFKTNGMSSTVLAAITANQWAELRGLSNTLRFAYLLDRPSIVDTAEHDNITVTVVMEGVTNICDTSKYTMSYNAGTKTISYVFNTNGTYTFNYAD